MCIEAHACVDIFDVVLAATAFGSTPIDPNWNKAARAQREAAKALDELKFL